MTPTRRMPLYSTHGRMTADRCRHRPQAPAKALFLFACLLILLFHALPSSARSDIAFLVSLDEQESAARSVIRTAGQPVRDQGIKITHGYYRGTKVHIARTGAGLVPTAQTTTFLLARYPVDCVLSYGVAGSLAGASPGSLFIANDVRQHNRGTAGLGGGKGLPNPIPENTDSDQFAEEMALLAACVAKKFTQLDVAVTTGTLVCGDEFIASVQRRAELRDDFDAAAVDMNGTGITIPCQRSETPYVVVRRFTDMADESAPLEFSTNTRIPIQELDSHVTQMLLDAWIDNRSLDGCRKQVRP
ncbi:5'-methylthioadenosine/S-adenosylhomocysteine nucleosidase [bacterium]|nr:5'-methylthioadenosine/S-adenosylhomocysteine nucleosidase [bacterium]